ncbi:MAG: hypothetical protein FWC02_01390 [Firmicutes bacterium]|nr:hypothetical protein [Bacillota bacterium]
MKNEIVEFEQMNGGGVQPSQQQSNALGMMSDTSLIQVAERAERELEAVVKIKRIALKVTNTLDWVSIGGTPYLQGSGAEKVAQLFGVSWRNSEPKFEYRKDGHYTVSYSGTFISGGREIQADGARSSYDEFFTGKDDPANNKIKKHPDEIDKRDVMIAAYTNFVNNGVRRILGIRNISWEDLAESGINQGDVKGYGFNSAAPKAMTNEAKDKKSNIQKMLEHCCGGNKSDIEKTIEKHTAFTGKDGKEVAGKKSLDLLSEKQITFLHTKIKTLYDKWLKDNPDFKPPAEAKKEDSEEGAPF